MNADEQAVALMILGSEGREWEQGDLEMAIDWASEYDVRRAHEHPAVNWVLGQLALTEYARASSMLRMLDPGDPDSDVVECTFAEFAHANAEGVSAEELAIIGALRPGEAFAIGGGGWARVLVMCVR